MVSRSPDLRYPVLMSGKSGARLNCGIHNCPQRCHQLYDHSKMDCQTIVESVCPRSHRVTRRCFKAKSTCRKCEAEDDEKERIKQRDHELDMQREAKQKLYMQQLQEVQDEIALERRMLRDRAEQNDQESSLKQHRQDLENLRRPLGRSQKVQATRRPPSTTRDSPSTTEGDHDSVCQGWSEGSPSEEPNGSNGGELSPGEEWSNQKKYEDARNEALDSLMEMIGLEDVKSAFLSIKSRVDTAVRQGIGLKTDRFGATLLGNPGTGLTVSFPCHSTSLTCRREDHCCPSLRQIPYIGRRFAWLIFCRIDRIKTYKRWRLRLQEASRRYPKQWRRCAFH